MPPDPRASRAVLIGTAQYRHPSWKNRQLPSVRRTVTDLAALLRDPRRWGLPEDRCTAVVDPQTKNDLVDPLRAASVEATDTLLVYYAGHGFVSARHAARLQLTVSCTAELDPLDAVDYDLVREAVESSRARRKLVILDCCYAGVVHGAMGSPRRLIPIRGAYVLSAVTADGLALAPPGAPYTAFGGELIALLRDGVEGAGAELTLDDLFDQLWQRLARRGLPLPERSTVGTIGTLPLVRNVFGDRAGGGDTVLAVDFGTSNTSAVLRLPDGVVRPLAFDDEPTLPSAVYATDDGTLLIGSKAVNTANVVPAAYEPTPKRRIDEVALELAGRPVPMIDVVAEVLRRCAAAALMIRGERPARLVLTHPHTWGAQRRAVLQAAAVKAELPSPEFVSEPVAAAAFFARRDHGEPGPQNQLMVIYDFGGGTFDVSTLRRLAGSRDWNVVRCDGLDDTGGVNLDEIVLEWLGAEISERDADVWASIREPRTATDRRNRYLLVQDVRKAKEQLSDDDKTAIHVPAVNDDITLTRETFERLAAEVIERTVRLTAATIASSHAGPDEVTDIVLIGGSSRIPLVKQRLFEVTGTSARQAPVPELVVAEGALPGPVPAAEPRPFSWGRFLAWPLTAGTGCGALVYALTPDGSTVPEAGPVLGVLITLLVCAGIALTARRTAAQPQSAHAPARSR